MAERRRDALGQDEVIALRAIVGSFGAADLTLLSLQPGQEQSIC